MPVSWNLFDAQATEIIAALQPATALDVGAGAGKYGHMLRSHAPACHSTAYEAERAYVDRFKLAELYHEVRPYPIQSIMGNKKGLNEKFDLVILGDVLEHLLKSEGLDLMHWMLYRCKYILVMVPWQYLQNDTGGVIWEAHVSSWHPSEFMPFTDVSVINGGVGWLGLLRGFLCSPGEYVLKVDQLTCFTDPTQ